MRDNWFDSQVRKYNQRGPDHDPDHSPDIVRLLSAGAVAAVALAFASGMEAPFVAPMFSQLLMFAALGFVMVAVFRQEGVQARNVTGWDQAALLLLLSLIGSLFVDQAAVQQALVERGLADPAAGGAGAGGSEAGAQSAIGGTN